MLLRSRQWGMATTQWVGIAWNCVAWRESDRSQSEEVSLYSHSHTHSYAHRELSLLGDESNKEVTLFTICSWHSYKLFGHLWTYTAFLSCRTEVSLTSLRTFCKLTGTLTLLSKYSLLPCLASSNQPYISTLSPTTLLPFLRMGVCVGEYPRFLMDAWEDYDFEYQSENDKPGI